MEKKAFGFETLAAVLASHLGANAVLKTMISTDKGQKALDKLLNRNKQYHPVIEGLMDTYLGPEFTEIHHELLKSKGVKLNKSKLNKAIRLGTSLATGIGTFAAGVPAIGDLTLYNSVLKNLPNSIIPDHANETIAFNSFNKGFQHRSKFKALMSSLLKSPVLGTIEEMGAKLSRGEKLKIPKVMQTKPMFKMLDNTQLSKEITDIAKPYVDKLNKMRLKNLENKVGRLKFKAINALLKIT